MYLKKIFSTSILLLSLGSLVGCGFNNDYEKITVVDMVGDSATIKKNPTKVACISRTTYDLLVAYGLGDKIDGVYKGALNDWSAVIYPDSVNDYRYEYEPSYELLISRGVDLVLSPEKYITDNLKTHGLNALTVCLYGTPSFDTYVTFFSQLVCKIWDDQNVKDRAQVWEEKVTTVIGEIQTELAKHQIDKKNLFYVRGDKDKGINYTDTVGSFTEYAYRLLEFNFIGATLDTNKPSTEAILAANPQLFVVGGPYQNKNINILQTTEPFKNLDVVKDNQIYSIPVGLTMFEQVSAMTPIFFIDQANKLYPQWFSYNVKENIKTDISSYFGVTLSDQQVDYMLAGLGPTGGDLY